MLKPFGTFNGLSVFGRKFWEVLNYIATVVLRLERQQSGNGVGLIEAPSKETLLVRLTNNLGDGGYEYAEQMPTSGGDQAVKSTGAVYAGGGRARIGTCFELNRNAYVPVPSYQIATVKYDSAGGAHYRFEYCCRSPRVSGSGSGNDGTDDPDTTDDGIVERTFVVQTGCTEEINGCKFPWAYKHKLRFTWDDVPTLVSATFEVHWDCGFLPCPHSGPPGGPGSGTPGSGSGTTLNDVWRRCGRSDEVTTFQDGDLLLPPIFFTAAQATGYAEPVFQVDGAGPCYRWIGVDYGVPAWPAGVFLDGCADESCDSCECDETCIRIESGVSGSTDYVELTLDEGFSFCDGTTNWSVTRGGTTGGLSVLSVRWVGDAWEISVYDHIYTWHGVYRGNGDGCPSGVFNLVETLLGSPPSIVNVSECAPTECPEDVADTLAFVGWAADYFGNVRMYISGNCNAPDAGYGDPAFVNELVGSNCLWTATQGTYADTNGNEWLINMSAQLLGGRWILAITFTRTSNLAGSASNSYQIQYAKYGARPGGTWTLRPNSEYPDNAAVRQAGCFEIRETIELVEVP